MKIYQVRSSYWDDMIDEVILEIEATFLHEKKCY